MVLMRPLVVVLVSVLIGACGEDKPRPPAQMPEPPPSESSVPVQDAAESTSAGGVSVQIIPEDPAATTCLQAVIRGVPGSHSIVWKVNGQVASSGTSARLCEGYIRHDVVTVKVGTNDKGAQASVKIVNSPPRVVDVSSSPEQIFAGTDVAVSPVAEDADDDQVDFSYQWLINGIADPLLTEATLPGDKFTKGDTIQVLITPNDFFADGPTYESYAQPVPNAPPQITSMPPQSIESLDYRYQVEVSDPDDEQFTFRLAESPDGMTIDETNGLIEWPLAEVAPGDYTIAIIVADQDGAEAAQEYNLTLGAPQ